MGSRGHVRAVRPTTVRVARERRRGVSAVEQDAGRAGKHVFGGVMDDEALELRGQLPGAAPLVPFHCRYDGPADEVSGLLPLSCRGLLDHRAHGAGEDKVEQDVT